jgi:quinol monooxygenase YgiN
MVGKTSGFAYFFAVAGLATALMGPPSARAQEASKAYVVSYIETMPEQENQAAALIKDYAENGRKAPGILDFEALQRIDRPNQFALLSAWKDQNAAESFAASDTAKQFHDKLQPLLIAPQDDRPSTGLDIGPSIAKDKGNDNGLIFVVTHVDLIPPKKDEGIVALKENAGPSRADPGNRRYDLLQQNSRGNHFTLVEAWTSRKALEAHEVAAHTRKLRDLLFPMGGALYDQRLYHPLD